MKVNAAIKLDLMPVEKTRLRANKIKVRDIPNHSIDDLALLLDVPLMRAMEIYALVEFQSIPSIGVMFAQDLISMGYYSLDELKDNTGVALIDDLEQLTGTWIDPCVEDQCRLVVHYANNRDDSKKWWDFTDERKRYRAANGYPSNRPTRSWFESRKHR